jgi:sulfide:quinone oxidoreductase
MQVGCADHAVAAGQHRTLQQIAPRNLNGFREGKWVHLAKVGFEKYFMRKMKKGSTEPLYEKCVLGLIGHKKLK